MIFSVVLSAILSVVLLFSFATAAWGLQGSNSEFIPGFGIVYGEGKTENDAATKRLGFTSRRLKDGDRIGSLALIGEEHVNGIPYELLDAGLSNSVVELKYQSVFMEVKRYFPISNMFNYYWGIRGGYSRIQGKIDAGDGSPPLEFEAEQVAPLALLAIPLMVENPGFLMLAFLDGTSMGLTFDVVPNRIWLDYGISAVLIPRYRDSSVVIDDLTIITQMLQLAIVF